MGSVIVVLVVLFIVVGMSTFFIYQVRKQHQLRKLQIRDLKARVRARPAGTGSGVMRTLVIGAAAAAAIGFAPFMVLTSPPAGAAPCTPPVQGPRFAGDITPCMACMNAAGQNVNAMLACQGHAPVGPIRAPDPQCAQYRAPGDIQQCEDDLHGAQHP